MYSHSRYRKYICYDPFINHQSDLMSCSLNVAICSTQYYLSLYKQTHPFILLIKHRYPYIGTSTDISFCDKTRVPMFYFDSKTEDWLCLYNALQLFFRKLNMTGCWLVTRTVKVISTDPEHGSIYKRNNNTKFVSFFVHMRKPRSRFRINYISIFC